MVASCWMFVCIFFFFFKQKTAYEMRISDWSSDVCSSDLIEVRAREVTVQSAVAELPMPVAGEQEYPEDIRLKYRYLDLRRERLHRNIVQIGRASCRERVCQYV